MKESSQSTELLQRFLAGSDQLRGTLAGLNENQLDLAFEEGAWNIRQIVHHLSDDGDVYSFVIKRTIASPGFATRFEGFPGNEPWGCALCTSRRKIDTSLQLIEAHRKSIAELMDSIPEALQMEAGFIGEDGKEIKLSIESILMMLIDHMDEHLQTIKNIKIKHNIA